MATGRVGPGGQWISEADTPAGGGLVANTAAVLKSAMSNGLYLGAAFGKRTRRGTYGRKVADWSAAFQNSAGTVSRQQGDAPPGYPSTAWTATITQNATPSFCQMNPGVGGQAITPKLNASFQCSAALWVRNNASRTLNFEVKFFNVAANRNIYWFCAVDPGGWRLITLAPSQSITGLNATDSLHFFRVTQKDDSNEGAWAAGESITVGDIFVDVASRPRFLLNFDDGNASQSANNPISLPRNGSAAPVTSTLSDVLTTSAAHGLNVGEPLVFADTAPTSLTVGTVYYVKTAPSSTTFTLATDAALTTTATTTGFAGTARYQYGGSPARSVQELVESYGFRGTLFIVPSWLGTNGRYGYSGTSTFMSQSDLLQMWADGWAVGSHTNTHPSNNESAGLRLLGPYGYDLSATFDSSNLSANYKTRWGINATTGRRRVTAGTQASPSVFTTENAHQFLVNQPLVFTDVAPTGCSLGVTYYVRSVPSGTTFTLATDQGSLANAVNNTTGAWSGTANYRWPGSAPDDSAIYADVVAGATGLVALGITTGHTFFALPQGAADEYVRSAIIRAGIKWVRGVEGGGSPSVHTIAAGVPSGGGVNLINIPGGWMMQPDAFPSDGIGITLAAVDTYVNECITQGACGCSYHHSYSTLNLPQLDRLCSTLRTKVDAGSIDVLTCDELAKELGIS